MTRSSTSVPALRVKQRRNLKDPRCTQYNPGQGKEICLLVATGSTLAKALAEVGISKEAWYKWQFENKDLCEMYARARIENSEALIAEIVDLCDMDEIAPEDVPKVKLQIDTRKWLASKLLPKQYGDSTQVKLADANGEVLSISMILQDIDGRSKGLPDLEGEIIRPALAAE